MARDCPIIIAIMLLGVFIGLFFFNRTDTDLPIVLFFLCHRDLNKNKFRIIQGLTFNGSESLETLKLKRNQISELEVGAFYEMKKIETL